MPQLGNPQAWDRYAYVNNSPLKYIDPTGHDAWWCQTASCSYNYYARYGYRLGYTSELDYVKVYLNYYRGITLINGKSYSNTRRDENNKEVTIHYKGRNWDLTNARIADQGLATMSNLSGKYSTSGGTYTLFYHPEGAGHYGGLTSGSNIDFYTSTTIPYQNLYHENAHLLDTMADNVVTTALRSDLHCKDDGTYLFGGNKVSSIDPREVLISESIYDPNWGSVDSMQHPSSDPNEQWADMYANYVAGNINLAEMSDWVYRHLNP